MQFLLIFRWRRGFTRLFRPRAILVTTLAPGQAMLNILKNTGPCALTRAFALTFGLVGLLLGILYSFGGLAIDLLVSLGWLSAETFETPGLSFGTLLAFGALLVMPLAGGLGGLLAGLTADALRALLGRLLANKTPR